MVWVDSHSFNVEYSMAVSLISPFGMRCFTKTCLWIFGACFSMFFTEKTLKGFCFRWQTLHLVCKTLNAACFKVSTWTDMVVFDEVGMGCLQAAITAVHPASSNGLKKIFSCLIIFMFWMIDETKLLLRLWSHLFQKEQDLFEKDYRFISLGRKPNFWEKALEKELRLS